ncbi:hypothetical protein ACIBL8_21480 [Streptomyces sp. NPDC050523]|uniref:hypothetical protein n=1 Tax=Streptomyces sp. NPDC050523 TaxID=3365622 RepID=UPI0037A1B095
MAVLPLGYRCTELIAGTGRVTLSRTGGGADYGAYALLYTTRSVGGGVEAIVAATRPEDIDPAFNLTEPAPYGQQFSETRPLMAWAAALNEAKAKEPVNGYTARLARALLTTAWSTRMVPPPGSVDLPLAAWEIETQYLVPYQYAGHTAVRIGRLVTVTAKET